MIITHVIASIDNNKGGPSRSVTQLLSAMGKENLKSLFILHTYKSKNPIIHQFKEPNISLVFYGLKSPGRLDGLEKRLLVEQASIFHGQTIWELPIHQMAIVARKLKVPYVISPRGMLEPWSLQQSSLKKKLALWLYQNKDLRLAACIHATAYMEAQNIRALGFKNPIAVIPNGVPVNELSLKNFENTGPVKKILFLSRIHPKKGIELLIEAWSHLPTKITQGWHIDIVGNGQDAYIAQLNSLIDQKGLDSSVFIKGPVYGVGKVIAYQEASLFVLPTYSENFGIVVAEALACGTPVITTHGAPWQDLETHECGWWIPTGVEPLKATLEQVLTLSENQLEVMGRNGRKLIEQKYSMQAVAEQMHQLYDWILNNKQRPDFVRLD